MTSPFQNLVIQDKHLETILDFLIWLWFLWFSMWDRPRKEIVWTYEMMDAQRFLCQLNLQSLVWVLTCS